MDRDRLVRLTHLGDKDCRRFPLYEITDTLHKQHCGPCYFREGFKLEMPDRMTVKEFSGLFGSPQMDPKTEAHLVISMGLTPPKPGEPLKQYRKRREDHGYSRPTPKLFPFASALWRLMGYQPPLATALLRFCEGNDEEEIATSLGHSIIGTQIALMKATRIAVKWT